MCKIMRFPGCERYQPLPKRARGTPIFGKLRLLRQRGGYFRLTPVITQVIWEHHYVGEKSLEIGNSTVMRVPLPGALSARMLPP
jgi:hypothetical protein